MNVPGTQHVFPSQFSSSLFVCRFHQRILREPIPVLADGIIVHACPLCWADEMPRMQPAEDTESFNVEEYAIEIGHKVRPIVPVACVDKNCPFTAKGICERCGKDVCNKHLFKEGLCNWCADVMGLATDISGCANCDSPPVFHCTNCGIGTCRTHASVSKMGLCVYCENGPWKLK